MQPIVFQKKICFSTDKDFPLHCFVSNGMLTFFSILTLIVRRDPVCIFTLAGLSCSVGTQDCFPGRLLGFSTNAQVR